MIADHTEVKRLLDSSELAAVHTTNRSRSDPDLQRRDERGRGNGRVSELLTAAIRSMIDVADERDLDSLFTAGPTTALTQTIAGLDDFELIAFIAVVDPEGASA
ncbi:hypothetical protein [Saccharopolyspora gregorii]|uniref:Uncharacterized protein n=1 Tax=Saccharopolyspora gregorii TaxID=33914 RepID=A0ABP6S2Z7_9PSEU